MVPDNPNLKIPRKPGIVATADFCDAELRLGLRMGDAEKVVELLDHALHVDVEYETDAHAMADAAIIKMKKLIFNAREVLTKDGWYKEPNTELIRGGGDGVPGTPSS